MKNRILIRATLLAALFFVAPLMPPAFAQPHEEKAGTMALLPVRKNGKWGYIDHSGKIAISPRFSVAGDFSEGLAWVRDEDGWFYLIDEKGKPILGKQYYRYADDFSEGLAAVQGERSDDKIGFIDRTGKIIIPAKFDGFKGTPLYGFRRGLAIVASNGKLGYIDRSGEFVIEPKYDKTSPFSEGLAVVTIGGESMYIGPDGRTRFGLSFATAFNFSEGLASVSFDRQKFGLINHNGVVVLLPQFDWLDPFAEGLAPANIGMRWYGHQKSGGKWGFVDKTGKFIIAAKYDSVNGFSEGLAPVNLNGKWGFIEKTGVTIISPQFDWAEPFTNGLSKVTVGDRVGYINKAGKYLWKP